MKKERNPRWWSVFVSRKLGRRKVVFFKKRFIVSFKSSPYSSGIYYYYEVQDNNYSRLAGYFFVDSGKCTLLKRDGLLTKKSRLFPSKLKRFGHYTNKV